MRQTLRFRRSHRPDRTETLDPITDRYVTRYESDIWRVDWKRFGFPFCGLYLISQRSGWPLKVGVSECVPKRLNGLQTSNWNELVCSGYWLLEGKRSAQVLERRVHDVLADRGGHLLGEWFDVRADKAREIVEFEAGVLGLEIQKTIPDTPKFEKVWDFIDRSRRVADMLEDEMTSAALYTGDGRNQFVPIHLFPDQSRKV